MTEGGLLPDLYLNLEEHKEEENESEHSEVVQIKKTSSGSKNSSDEESYFNRDSNFSECEK